VKIKQRLDEIEDDTESNSIPIWDPFGQENVCPDCPNFVLTVTKFGCPAPSAIRRRLVKYIGWANQNIGGQKVVKRDKCMGVSQLLGARPRAAPKVYAYAQLTSLGP